ncbi:hypothetical protein D3C81_1882660 [compost metagenome]
MSRKYKLPWHRVVNVKGEIALGDDESSSLQRLYLQGEGIVFDAKGVIDLQRYQYHPEPDEDYLLPPKE